ncbi:MAG TPA: DUF4390 domain-containing protein [Polyangia bacterium]|jgi:hypothetical protein|nr:DUF4390 domain-containing protein [Polyangia bacterium]
MLVGRRIASVVTSSIIGLTAVVLLASAARAADPLPVRVTGIEAGAGKLLVSVGMQDLISGADLQRLSSGFATRVLIRIYLHQEGADEPVSVAYQRAEIVYDLWDERFRVRVARDNGGDVQREARTPEEAIWGTCALWHFPVADLRRLRPGARYFLAFRADLNPISEELLADVRRWLVQPPPGQRRVGAGDSVFGSFVSIFVNPRVEDSERQLRFLSQPFTIATAPLRGSR